LLEIHADIVDDKGMEARDTTELTTKGDTMARDITAQELAEIEAFLAEQNADELAEVEAFLAEQAADSEPQKKFMVTL
jgi:hypothetical protein